MRRSNWAAYGACVWALAFALMSFYWAAGGLAAIDTIGGEPERLARARDPIDQGDLDDTALIGHLAFWDPWWILGAGLFVLAAWQQRGSRLRRARGRPSQSSRTSSARA
jgi:hypothetical protein